MRIYDKEWINSMITAGSRQEAVFDELSYVELSSISQKIQEDIFFLRDRISHNQVSSTRNTAVLDTYEKMLRSREAMLELIQSRIGSWSRSVG